MRGSGRGVLVSGVALVFACSRSELTALSPPDEFVHRETGGTSGAPSSGGSAGSGAPAHSGGGGFWVQPLGTGGQAPQIGASDAGVSQDAAPDAPNDGAVDAAPPVELCNGIDDDFDGLVDEGIARCEAGSILPMVVTGAQYTCGLDRRGRIRCWGLGFGVCPEVTPNCPVLDVPSGQFTEISAGVRVNVCALRTSGEVVCFGEYTVGVPLPGAFVHVAAGGGHGCGLRPDGSIECWGDGKTSDRCFATSGDCGQAAPPAGAFVEVSAGNLHSCARREDGTVTCWGNGETVNDCVGSGVCGQSADPEGTFTEISAGWTNSCGLSPDGEIRCWGSQTGGRSTPPPGPFRRMARSHAWVGCAIRLDGTVDCWGNAPSSGSLVGAAGVFEEIAVGAHHACGLTKKFGPIECWNDGTPGCGVVGSCGADQPPADFP